MPAGNDGAASSRWLVKEWTTRLAEVLASIAGSRPQVNWTPSPPGSPAAAEAAMLGSAVLWWEQSFSVAPGACFWVGAPEECWSSLGRTVLSAAGVDGAEAAEARGTFIELAGQSLEGLAAALGVRLGGEVTCPGRTERPQSPVKGECFLVEITSASGPALKLLAVPSPELADALVRKPERDAAPPPAPPPAPGTAAAPPESSSPMLDLLLDVELPVSISFGRTQLPLKEALKLTTGSIVELNRAVSEPVDVIVNNCVIARGEVVVIEGNYGVRIREIMSREGRIRNLR